MTILHSFDGDMKTNCIKNQNQNTKKFFNRNPLIYIDDKFRFLKLLRKFFKIKEPELFQHFVI